MPLLNLVTIFLVVCTNFLTLVMSGTQSSAKNCPRRGQRQEYHSNLTDQSIDVFFDDRRPRRSFRSSPSSSSAGSNISLIRAGNSSGGSDRPSRIEASRRNRRSNNSNSFSSSFSNYNHDILSDSSNSRGRQTNRQRPLTTPLDACSCPPGWLLSPLAPVLGTTCTSFYTLPSTVCSSLGKYSILTCQRHQVDILSLCKIGKLLVNTCSDVAGSQPVQRNGEWRCIEYAKVPEEQLPNVAGVCPRGSFPQCMIVTKVIA
jgi:hypothetical protein